VKRTSGSSASGEGEGAKFPFAHENAARRRETIGGRKDGQKWKELGSHVKKLRTGLQGLHQKGGGARTSGTLPENSRSGTKEKHSCGCARLRKGLETVVGAMKHLKAAGRASPEWGYNAVESRGTEKGGLSEFRYRADISIVQRRHENHPEDRGRGTRSSGQGLAFEHGRGENPRGPRRPIAFEAGGVLQ